MPNPILVCEVLCVCDRQPSLALWRKHRTCNIKAGAYENGGLARKKPGGRGYFICQTLSVLLSVSVSTTQESAQSEFWDHPVKSLPAYQELSPNLLQVLSVTEGCDSLERSASRPSLRCDWGSVLLRSIFFFFCWTSSNSTRLLICSIIMYDFRLYLVSLYLHFEKI